jgi:RHS repeat-associated protein
MRGTRLLVAMAAALLLLGSGIAWAAQDSASQADAALSSPPAEEPGPEIESERTQDTQTFRLPGGELETRIYESPVNYRNAEGEWEPIGEGLEEAEGGTLTNGPNRFDATLPDQLGEGPVRLTIGDQWVSTELLGDSSQPAQLEGQEASYALPGGAAIDYAGVPNGTKESIEIAGPNAPSSFRFALDASAGLRPVLSEEGAVEFRDEDGRVIATLPAPLMYDSATPAPAESSEIQREIHYELEQGSAGNWILKVVADPDWLSSPERVWPVFLDPSTTVPSPSLDCFFGLYGTATTYSGCGSAGTPRLKLQYKPATSEQTAERERSLLKFDTSSIPSNAQVSEATVGLFAPWEPSHITGVQVRRATKGWTKDVTWFKFDGSQSWTTAGGDFSTEGAEILASERSNLEGWWNFSKGLAPIVEGWVSGKVANQGLLVKLKSEEGCAPPSCTDSWAQFNSSATTETGTRPYLSVVYSLPKKAPTVTTQGTIGISETSTTVRASVNPNNAETTYQFQYGLTTSYGNVAPATLKAIGGGSTEVTTDAPITGLTPNTTYHYRITATNEIGKSVGEDRTFKTPVKPTATTEAASEVNAASARLRGVVNPNGWSTFYSFEYGTTTGYGSRVPIPSAQLGSGTSSIPVSEKVFGLAEGTTYHYRTSATNEAGTVYGADKTFTTLDPPQTTITSPKPSYTAHELSQIAFSSDESGSTFKCSLDDPKGVPQEPCSSPYALAQGLSEGWHTFVVSATDKDGLEDSTPAKYIFNTAIYPPAPSTSKLTAPTEGEKTASYYTLQAEWKSGSGLTGVAFQMKLQYWQEFRPVPAECVVDGKGKQVSWPLPVSQSQEHSDPVFLKVQGCSSFKNAGYPEEDIKFRAVFDGEAVNGVNAAGASEPVATEFASTFGGVGAPTDASEQVGPANLDLLTGNYTISHTDVSIPVPGSESNLEFTRTYESNFHGGDVPSYALGGLWQPSMPTEQAYEGEAWSELRVQHEDAVPKQYDPECEAEGYSKEECLVEEEIPAADWIELLDNEGGSAAFEIKGGNYVAPEYMKEYVLTKHGEGSNTSFELAGPEGTHTLFVKNESGLVGSYRMKSVSWQATAKSARMVYDLQGGAYRLMEIIAPAPVTCNDAEATETVGCRVLSFHYFKCQCSGSERLSSITYYNSSGQTAQSQIVAEYKYDSSNRLIEEWDPRLPNLRESYTYNAWDKMLSLTPPGEKPWEFGYDGFEHGRLKSVTRASLLTEGPSMAQISIAYEVPISGSGAPYDMSPSTVATWGQTDYPVNATAIFPPTEIPGEPPSDYSQASITYMGPDGYAVNSASPQLPGASGPSISTAETDRHGNVIRSLSPQSRLTALAAGAESVSRSHQLDSQSTYSADGTEMLESLGPLHKVRLQSGSTVEARARTVVEYDKEAPKLKEGEAAPHLPTTETTSAKTLKGENLETRVTKTEYDWTLRKPTKTIVDAETGGLQLTTRIAYDPATGLPTERSLPAKLEGGDAHTTKTVYYTATGDSHESPCYHQAALAGLPCETKPAAQPGTEGQPELLVTKYTKYSPLDEPEEIVESPGGKEEKEKTRKTIKTYDAVGRETTSRQIGGGTALPPTRTTYNEDTGLPETQEFICESECGAGFGYASAFGEAGSATGQLNHPADVAIDAKGNLWVADKANNRIEQFTEGGGSAKAFGSSGSTGGKLSSPSGIAIDSSGNAWVTDTGNTRVEKFSEKGEFKAVFGTNVNKTKVESGGTQAEKNLCTAASGNVCQAGTAGSLEGQMKEPVGIATSAGGNLFVVEKGNGRVEKFNPSGELLAKFGGSGSGSGQFKEPSAIAVAPDASVWVADSGNNRIQHWSSTFSLLGTFGKEGAGNGEFKHPDAIEADSSGNVLIADQGNGRVQELSASGAFIARFGASESGPGQFSFSDPVGIAVNAKGNAWVTDPGHNQIQKWVPQAEFDSQAVTTLYDKLGRPVEYFDAEGNPSSVSYDLLGRPVHTTDGKGSQTMAYDSTSGVPIALEDSAAGTFTASYDANGSMVEQGLPNGLIAKTTYNEASEPTHLTYTKATNCTEKCTWLDESEELSIYGQVLSQTSLASSQQYSYDKAGRLSLVKDTPQGGSCTTRQYAYDADSNRTKLTTRAPGVGGACDTSSEGTPQSYSYDAADRLTDSGIVYDSFGRITSLPGKDAGGSTLTTSFYSNEMVASQSQGGITNSYRLDATGRPRQVVQTGSKEGTEVFHYTGGSDAPVWTERGSAWTRNIAGIGGGLAAIQPSTGETSLQLTDLHGDVVATASLSQTAIEPAAKFEFDEFGNPKSGSAGRFGWLGGKQRRTELSSGVIQMGVRSYVPEIGRFISRDPIDGGSANTYDYANADPVNGLDLSGERACEVHRGKAKARTLIHGKRSTLTFTVSGSAVCSRNTRDRRLSIQITGGIIHQPPPLVATHIRPSPSSTTTCPRYHCEHSTSGSASATVPCNRVATGSFNVTVRVSWLPRGSNKRQYAEETYRYPIEWEHYCPLR